MQGSQGGAFVCKELRGGAGEQAFSWSLKSAGSQGTAVQGYALTNSSQRRVSRCMASHFGGAGAAGVLLAFI